MTILNALMDIRIRSLYCYITKKTSTTTTRESSGSGKAI